jgi:integrase
VDWRDSSGRRRQRQFKTKDEAKLFRDKLVRERYAKEYGVLLEASFAELLEIYEAKKPWRTESYRERVMRALRLTPFQDLPSAEAIEAYRDARLKAGIKPSTVRQDLAEIHDSLKWVVKLRYLAQNPAKEVERPTVPIKQDDPATFIPYEEFEKLLEASGRDAPLFDFAVWRGLRTTEVLALEWADVKDGYILVRRGKGRRQRLVPLLKAAREAMSVVPRHLTSTKVLWWGSDRHALLRGLQRRCQWAKITKYRFHDLRHTFGSYAAMSGVNLEVIAKAMGSHVNDGDQALRTPASGIQTQGVGQDGRLWYKKEDKTFLTPRNHREQVNPENPGVASSILALPTNCLSHRTLPLP